jgi:SAM-dependent methyltransferase
VTKHACETLTGFTVGDAIGCAFMTTDRALAAYEAFAPFYNEFNYRNDYEMWLGQVLLSELEKHELKTGRVLDVACGTGRAFGPLLRRGWEIHGCDLSPAMLDVAREEGGDRVELSVADMRALPVFGRFELALVLNDSVDYLLGDGELESALSGIRSNLAEGGLLLFDSNSRLRYETSLTSEVMNLEHQGRRWTWRGLGPVEGLPSTFEARVEGSDIEPITHRQRYRTVAEVHEAIAAAGLECLATLGMEEINGQVVLAEPLDERRHYKVVYIARAI